MRKKFQKGEVLQIGVKYGEFRGKSFNYFSYPSIIIQNIVKTLEENFHNSQIIPETYKTSPRTLTKIFKNGIHACMYKAT